MEKLKALKIGKKITFLDENVVSFVGDKKVSITELRHYTSDEGNLTIVEFGDFSIIAHDLSSDIRYFICQRIDIENCFNDEDDFRSKIIVEDSKSYIYKRSDLGAVYDLYNEKQELTAAICEYISKNYYLHFLLIEKIEDTDETNFFQGFKINATAYKA